MALDDVAVDETDSSVKKRAQQQRLKAGLEILSTQSKGLHKDKVYTAR